MCGNAAQQIAVSVAGPANNPYVKIAAVVVAACYSFLRKEEAELDLENGPSFEL